MRYMGSPRMMLHLAYTRHLPMTTVENVRPEGAEGTEK